jgi:hypothetical protein
MSLAGRRSSSFETIAGSIAIPAPIRAWRTGHPPRSTGERRAGVDAQIDGLNWEVSRLAVVFTRMQTCCHTLLKPFARSAHGSQFSRGAVGRQLRAEEERIPGPVAGEGPSQAEAFIRPLGGGKESNETARSKVFSWYKGRSAPFRSMIPERLSGELSARSIYEEPVADNGSEGKFHSVQRGVATLDQTATLSLGRMDLPPSQGPAPARRLSDLARDDAPAPLCS